MQSNSYFSTSDNVKIFYSCNFSKESPPDFCYLLNYGLVCSNQHWQEQTQYFDKQGIPYIIHNYRGHYNSGVELDLASITFDNIANDIKELLEYLNVKDVYAVGHSMGVNITLELALKCTRIKKITLISGSVVPVENIMFNSNIMSHVAPSLTKALKKYPNLIGKIWSKSGWNPLLKKIVHYSGFNVETVSREFIDIYLNRIGQLGPELFFKLLQEMNNHQVSAHLNKIKIPCLIIGGDKDNVIPNYLQRMLHKQIEKSEIYIIKDGSHVPQVDFPTAINQRLVLFNQDQVVEGF